jgi:hypothetical protein
VTAGAVSCSCRVPTPARGRPSARMCMRRSAWRSCTFPGSTWSLDERSRPGTEGRGSGNGKGITGTGRWSGLQRWAMAQGAAARIEARTADGRRRTDVSVSLPRGSTLAVEVQLSSITDAEIVDRGEDYRQAGSTVVWVWRDSPPHVLYEVGQPGWMYDLDLDRIGLVCGEAHPGRLEDADGSRTLSAHWPPCSGDATTVRWMPLAELRLTANRLCASERVLTRQAEEAAEAAAEASRHARSRLSAVPTGIGRDEVPRPWPPPVNADTARVQAWAADFLDREISHVEGQLARLATRLRILRMHRRLLPDAESRDRST